MLAGLAQVCGGLLVLGPGVDRFVPGQRAGCDVGVVPGPSMPGAMVRYVAVPSVPGAGDR